MPFILLFFILLLLGVLWYAWFIEPSQLEITEDVVIIPPHKLKRAVRILFLSDLHMGRFTNFRTSHLKIERLLAHHVRQPWDVVIIGGDLLDKNPAYFSELKLLFGHLSQAGAPIFTVLGNHDKTAYRNASLSDLVELLKSSGVTVLRDATARLKLAGQEVALVGLDELEGQEAYVPLKYHHHLSYKEYKKRAVQMGNYSQHDSFAPGVPRILVVHNPDGAYQPGIVPDLILSGHTHGGQIFLLDWFARLLPWFVPRGSFGTQYGRIELLKTTLIISRGFGGSLLPLRLLRPPQAHIITLLSQ